MRRGADARRHRHCRSGMPAARIAPPRSSRARSGCGMSTAPTRGSACTSPRWGMRGPRVTHCSPACAASPTSSTRAWPCAAGGAAERGPREWQVRDAAARATSLQRLAALGLLRPGFTAIRRGPAAGGPRTARPSRRRAHRPARRRPSSRRRARAARWQARAADSAPTAPRAPARSTCWRRHAPPRSLSGLAPPRRCAWPRSAAPPRSDCRRRSARSRPARSPTSPASISTRSTVAGCASLEDAIVFGATRAQVSDVWTGGAPRVSAHRLLAFDDEELAALPGAWAQRLKLGAAA